jgi:tyrosinase
MSDLSELQRQTDALLAEGGPNAAFGATAEAEGKRRFSVFIVEDAERAHELAMQFVETADSIEGDTGLEAVLNEAATAAIVESPDLVRHAMMMFLTHHEKGRLLKIRDLEERSPNKVLPSPKPSAAALVSPEAQLNWFREDAKTNEHHEHWHVVYPNTGLLTTPPKLNDRHGELFFYMHEQMLARYDTERTAVNLPLVIPFSDYNAPIAEGYDPGPGLSQHPGPQNSAVYSPRKSNTTLKDIPAVLIGTQQDITISGQKTVEQLLDTAISSGKFNNGNSVTAQSLGETEETTIKRTGPAYGNHHGNGHLLIALSHLVIGNEPPGVMIDTATAIRDPIFWQWHRHVDDYNFRWQQQQPENNFSDAPPVLIRKTFDGSAVENQSPDIILVFRDKIVDANGNPADGQAFGEEKFGGETNWNKDFSAGEWSTNTLQTKMETRDIELSDGTKVPVDYLDQKEFCYFIRAENKADVVSQVTVRLFLVAEEFAENRRMWIEMDKFQRTLQPKQKAVLYQPAEMSSVIKKPGIKPPGSKIETPNPSGIPSSDQENYCSCGWAYNLLLPRGTAAGMKFRLLVMLTDWNYDRVAQSKCGSMSFCGAVNQYPDRRAMGYPFDRKFSNNSISETFKPMDNAATRNFLIRDMT